MSVNTKRAPTKVDWAPTCIKEAGEDAGRYMGTNLLPQWGVPETDDAKSWLTAACERGEWLESVVDRLPITKDGVPVVPGFDFVWCRRHVGRGEYEWMQEFASTSRQLVAQTYFSKEAALEEEGAS